MENSMRRKVVAVALIGIAVASFAVANFASALTGKGAGKYQTGVFAEVYGWGTWITLETTDWTELLSITLPNIPISAYYYVVCDGHAGLGEPTILNIAIGVDSIVEDAATIRFYQGAWGTGDSSHLSGIHTERLYYLGAGSHTFYFIGKLYQESGYAEINYHTITVVVFTDGSLTELPTTTEGDVAPYGEIQEPLA